ncbi:MAG: hypothetical protein IIY95_06465 [Firmicutes bacterium]|nr:hypothetical protein [Bacillota bacterium]
MKGYDLLKGMGHIDDDLLAEALEAEVATAPEERKVVRLSRFAGWSAARRWGTAVAAVAVLCLAGLGAFGGMGQRSKDATPAAGAPMLGVTQEGEQKNTMNLGLTAESAEEEDAPEMAEEPAEVAELDEAAPAETEPLPTEGVEMPTSDSYAYAGMDADAYNGKTLVSAYPDAPDGCYAAPKNGEAGYSEPLRAAMREYGDDAVYRVWVDIFKDEVQLDPDDPEVAELLVAFGREHNITTAIETYTDANGADHVYPTLHATYEQLQNFAADEAHGWMLFLYDERVK